MSAAIARLLVIWAILLALLAVTVGATLLPLGLVRTGISYAIATLKAALVLWYFMELKRETVLVRFSALAGFVWMLFMLLLIGADYVSR